MYKETIEQHFCPDNGGHKVAGNDEVRLMKDNTTYCHEHYHLNHEGQE